MAHCTVKSLMEADPRYQMVRSWYEPDTKWFRIADDLQRYRDNNDKPSDYYPSEDEKDEFLSFVSHSRKAAEKRNRKLARRLNSRPLRETIEVYKSMLQLGYNRNQLESRIGLVKIAFTNQIRAAIKAADAKGQNISVTEAIRRLGGYQKMLDRAFDKLAKATVDTEYDYLVRAYGEPKSDKQREGYRQRAAYNAKEMNKVAENRERFATLATRSIADAYGLVVDHNGVEMSLKAFRDVEDEEDAKKNDTGGSGGDRYVDVRTKKIMETLSTEVKTFLSTIPETDNKGKVQRDDLLRPKYLDARQIAYVLPAILRFSTPQTMMADLNEAADRYPFLANLVNKLNGAYRAKDRDYQSLIYTNFKRAANLYGYIELDRGSYKADKANTRAQGNALVRSASVNMGGTQLGGNWTIYDTGGMIRQNVRDIADEVVSKLSKLREELGFVNMMRDGFDKRKAFKNNGEPTNYKDYTKYSQLAQTEGGEAAIKRFIDEHPDAVATITKAARGIGLDLSEYQVLNAIMSPVNGTTGKILGFVNSTNVKGTNRMASVIDELISIYETAAKPAGKNSGELKFTAARDLANTVTSELAKLNSAFAVSFFDELENRVLVEGSTLQTHVYPNLIHDTMDALNNEQQLDEDAYNEFLDREYLQYEDMTLNGRPTGWLDRLRSGRAFTYAGSEGIQAGPFKLVHMTAFNHVEYENLSLPQKIAAQLTMWGQMNYAVECPIQGDYLNAWDFIQGAGVENHVNPKDLDDIIEQRVAEELAAYKEANGQKASLSEQVRIRTRVANQVLMSEGLLKKADRTYHTEWPVVRELADEVMIEINRIDRLRKEQNADPQGVNGPRVDVLDRNGLRFQIFPELNDNGFYDKYHAFESDVDAVEFVRQQVAEQLQKQLEKDQAYLERTKALSNPMLENFTVDKRRVNLYSATGQLQDLSSASALITLQNFFLDYYYGRVQMVKLMNGGLQNFDGILDFEKRNMMNHATRRPAYTEATWNGEKVGRENQNCVYLEDEKSESAYKSDFDEMLDVLHDEEYLDDSQWERMKGDYESHNATDGQAYRYYPSYRVTQIELGKWNDEREKVYNYLMFGQGRVSKEEIASEMQRIYNPNEKPVYTGWEIVNNTKIPVLHKYSETVLFPLKVMKMLMGDEVPAHLAGMAMAAERLSTPDRPFDIFLFRSCVKKGGHTVLDPFGFVKDENGNRILDENGKPVRKCTTAEQIRDYITSGVDEAPWAVHELPMKYYGEAAATPAHGEDDEISWSSQAVKNIWGNIEEVDEVSDERLTVDGRRMKSSEARDLSDEIDAATVAEKYKEVQELFDDPDELRDVLMSELAGKTYSSPELEFAISSGKVPYFYPAIARGAEQLFNSIIKKRMTRPKTKGANILQVTSLGRDVDPFGVSYGLSDNHKLHIVFEGKGKNKRIKYIECYLPIHDSRLEIFADENGVISPERLKELVDKKIIPEDAIQFVAYRTPSDEMHSILPLRIVGFTSKVMGANIILPKEAMKMTGHDFDGDKLRCHFQDFKIEVDDDALYQQYLEENYTDEKIIKTMLGQDKIPAYKGYKRDWLKNPDNYKEGMIKMEQYDYSKKPHENSQVQRDNAKVQLAFAQLTSPAGSRRMIIPGGSADTDMNGAVFHIVRSVHDNPSLKEKLAGFNLDLSSDENLYHSLRRLDNKKLGKVMNVVNSDVAPFSFEHSNEAYSYIIGGKKMISVYALYASAGQMLQRLMLKVNHRRYRDKKTGQVKSYGIGFFGQNIDYLYQIRNKLKRLGSLTQSDFINSAVDNGKNPRLGYLNQDPKLAEMTNYLVAAGMSSEQVHLILNQPVMIEVVKRMYDERISLANAMRKVRDELVGGQQVLAEYKKLWKASDIIFKLGTKDGVLKEDAYVKMFPMHFEDIKKTEDLDIKGAQIALLSILMNQNKYAMRLSKFIKGTRPEASSDGIASTLAGTMVITGELGELRGNILDEEMDAEQAEQEELERQEEGEMTEEEKKAPVQQPELISGMADVIAPVEIFDDDDTGTIAEKISHSKLRHVTALEALMQDKVYRFLSKYFPQAKEQWRTMIDRIVSKYNASQKEKESIIRVIGNEMVLWSLLKSSVFSADVHADGRELLINMPKRLIDLKSRIAREKERKEKNEETQDAAARSLIDNVFLRKLSVDIPQGESEKPRVFFQKGGVTMDNFAEKITYDWAAMSVSPHEEIRQLAIDLFKYNAFSNGFGFGMYEFSHFAPYTVLEGVQGYLDSLNAVRDSALFTDDAKDAWNFYVQYHMNHWGDERLVKRFKPSELPNAIRTQIGYDELDAKAEMKAEKKFGGYDDKIVFVVRKNNGMHLYYLGQNADGSPVTFELAKTGHRTKRNQITVQYEPKIDFDKIQPHQAGLDSAWGDFTSMAERNSEASDISNDTMSAEERAAMADSLTEDDSKKPVKHHGSEVRKSSSLVESILANAAKNVLEQEKKETEKKKAKETVNEQSNGVSFYTGYIKPEKNVIFVFGSNPEGRHGAGAAKIAREQFGAVYGQGEGLQGNAYALPTKDLRIKENNSLRSISREDIIKNIKRLYDVARQNSDKVFKIAYTNGATQKTLNGYTGREMFDMFMDAGTVPENIQFSAAWQPMYEERIKIQETSELSSAPAASGVVDIENLLNSLGGGAAMSDAEQHAAFEQITFEDGELGGMEESGFAHLAQVEVDENGNEHVVTRTASWTPDVVRQSREQKAYVLLNQKLRQILTEKGIGIGALTHADARLRLQGIADFSTTKVNAAGLRELIRLAEGYQGEEALPEEFAHVALEMLGHDHPLVKRLLAQLSTNERALREAFEGQYEDYVELYKNDRDKLVLEAAGKLVAKNMLQQQEIETPEVKSLLRRIIDKIKELLRSIGSWRIWNAILDANEVSSQLARDILSGRLLDDMSLENISSTESYYQVQKDLTGQSGIIQNILKRETKRLALLKKRAGPVKNDQKSASMIATEKQIGMLEDAIRQHKVESAVLDYLTSSLSFLKETEASLDNKVTHGDKVNSICRKLNAVRDTLYSYASVMKLIDEAIESGEIVESHELSTVIKSVKDQMDKFMTKYNRLGMRFFERMLANVYGEHGVTRTLGPHKGEHLSIAEMARRGDRDISIMTRMLSSLADCGDYVLAAFDDITRRAKMSGRQRAAEAHRRIVVAWDKYSKATGSTDQSFMFEYEIGEDGKRHRNGKYISKEKAKLTLTKPQLDYYNEVMNIKQKIDACLPPVLVSNPYQIITLRKVGMERIKDADGIHGKLDAFGENVRNAILDTSEEADKDERSMQSDFQGNKIDNLPVKYVTKGKHESWDDMTDDVAMSLVAYASMGYEYSELNQVLAMLENARYMSMNREIEQKSGRQRLIERVRTGKTEDDLMYDEPFTKKQMHTNLQRALDDFFQMHLYGKLQKQEGGLFGTKISRQKAANMINAAASYSQMAFNFQQRISNIGAGMMNILVETAGKGALNAASFAWATKEYLKHTSRRLLDTGALESDDKLSLFAERYDLHQNNGKFSPNDSFKKGRLSRIVNTNLLFAGLNAGEDYLALTTALAIAKNTKVKNAQGKEESLWDVFEVKYTDTINKTGAYLQIKPGYTMADGSPIDKQAEEKFAKLVIGTNFRLQGIYNSDDKSAIQQYAFGSLVMMYRKWIHPSIVRRYGAVGYNPLTGMEGEGYFRTLGRWIGESFKETLTDEEGNKISMNIIRRIRQTFVNMQLNKSKMTDYEKSNLARALVELSAVMGVSLALMLHSKFAPGKDDDDDDFSDWFTSMAVYQLFRLRNELGSVAPTPLIIREIENTLSSPIAAMDPMKRIMRIPLLFWPGTWNSEVKSGAFKGKSKAEKIIFELPVLSLYKQIHHVIDPTPLINYYKNDLQF